MESIGNTTESLLDAFNSSLPEAVDPTPYAFYGSPQEVEGYDGVSAIVVADQSGTLFMEFSMDNEVWDASFNYTYPEIGSTLGTAMHKSTPTLAKYYRTGFINTSDSSQNTFRLQTLLHNDRQLSAEFDTVEVGPESTALLQAIVEIDTSINTFLHNEDVSVVQAINQVGAFGNVLTANTFGPYQTSTSLDVSQFKDSVISYQDLSPAHTGNLMIFASNATTDPTGTYVCIGLLIPFTNASMIERHAYDVINLAPFNHLYILNNDIAETHNYPRCSVYSS
jgi:hypothetical protein